MKILRFPPSKETWTLRVECTGFGHSENGCHAELELTRNDLYYRKGVDGAEIGFQCVCCGEFTNIGRQFFPEDYHELKPFPANMIN